MIHDKFDPSGQGMFSKSGRQSGDARSMIERVISSQVNTNKNKGSILDNQMNAYSSMFEDIIGSKSNNSVRPNSANPYNQTQSNHLHDYQIIQKQKMHNAQSIEPFAKQITRDQFNKSYMQQSYCKNQTKVKIISDQSDPRQKKPKLVWDILKVYKSQKKTKKHQVNMNDTKYQQNNNNLSQMKQGQSQLMINLQQNDSKIILNRTKNNDSPSKQQYLRESQISPTHTRASFSRENQKSQSGQKGNNQKNEEQIKDSSLSKSFNKDINISINDVPVYPERLKTRISGFTDFKRQMNRSKDSYDKFYKVNENRFELLKECPASSNIKHQRDYSFNKQLNREVVSAFKPDEKIPDNGYKPNFEVTKRSLGRVGPCFNKLSPHKSLENKLVGVFQGTHYEYDVWVKNRNKNSNVFKNNRLNLVSFDRQLSREKNPNHALPGYMQNVRSRISLQDLSQKMLEENSYMDQKYLNMNSVFSTKSSISRQSTKSFTQQNFFRSASLMRSPSAQKERVKTSNSSVHYLARDNSRTQNTIQNNVSGQLINNQFYY